LHWRAARWWHAGLLLLRELLIKWRHASERWLAGWLLRL
jgi:hypothetical protein